MFDWLTGIVQGGGYLGIALLMFAENLFPPIPSELIMPLAGFNAARGQSELVWVILAGSLGSLAGALFWYGIGRWIGCPRLKRWSARHGRLLTLEPEEVERSYEWFRRHGGLAVFLCRLLPGLRTLISVPAGMARMPLLPFLLYSTAGTVLWTAFLTLAGYWLESGYHVVADYLDPVSTAVVVLLLLGYLYRVATFGRRSAS
ncbi:MAG: DedA family protein [Tistlia sp.]|uniref:DedA family protein n=1 Tax=Tistlia sp. TaxID=3057121 RepID=UPI0034A24DF1